MNRRELSEALKVSEVTLSSWLREGMPVTSRGGQGKLNEHSLNDVVAWMKATGRGPHMHMNLPPNPNDSERQREESDVITAMCRSVFEPCGEVERRRRLERIRHAYLDLEDAGLDDRVRLPVLVWDFLTGLHPNGSSPGLSDATWKDE